jgi:glycosyltransferase involved in cell wall biosynthesis
MTVSVVVATYRRAPLLPRLVRALEAQRDVDEIELVIVDDASDDDTWAALQELAAGSSLTLRPLRQEQNAGPAAARNRGWRAARGDVIAFTDDDCTPQPGWLRALVAAGAEADVVQGLTRPDPGQQDNAGPFSRSQEVLAESRTYQTCNIAYRRAVLEQLGGFDEGFRQPFSAGEDADLGWRAATAGARTAFAPDAVVLHDVRPSSFRAALRDVPRWGGVVRTARRNPDVRALLTSRYWWRESHKPALLAAAGLAIAMGPARRPVTRLAALALALPYVDLRRRRFPLAGRRDLRTVAQALAVDLAEVAVLACASVKERSLLL